MRSPDSTGTARSCDRPSWPLPRERSRYVFLSRTRADRRVVERLTALGITEPLPVQAGTIPDALARDVCAQAPTGSGKTLAFALPLLAAGAATSPGAPRALVLVPTRELADQVRDVLASLMGGRSKRVVALYGGTGYGAQSRALRQGVDIVVACPGRLEDLVARGDVRLDHVQIVVLDEADRMVDMGFVRPVCRLLDRTAAGRQMLHFSATLGPEVEAISTRYQRDPVSYRYAGASAEEADVAHHFSAGPPRRTGEGHGRTRRSSWASLRLLPDEARR